MVKNLDDIFAVLMSAVIDRQSVSARRCQVAFLDVLAVIEDGGMFSDELGIFFRKLAEINIFSDIIRDRLAEFKFKT